MDNDALKKVGREKISVAWEPDLEPIAPLLHKAIQKSVADCLEVIFKDVFASQAWGKDFNPLEIWIHFPEIGKSYDEFGLKWSFNIEKMMKDHIQTCERDGSFADNLAATSIAFKKLAEKIDRAVKKGREAARNRNA